MTEQTGGDRRLAEDAAARPPVDDATVAAVGAVTEALETVEVARGFLYQFHRLTGSADLALGRAVDLLREAEHQTFADQIETELVGRNVLPGRWTFQVVEDYDEHYYGVFQRFEAMARELAGGHRHLAEAAMKRERRSAGRPGHEAQPDGEPPS